MKNSSRAPEGNDGYDGASRASSRHGGAAHAGPNHERWLVSYADFITLLFALFVVLFASSNADHTKVRAFAEAVAKAIEHSGISMSPAGNLPVKLDQAALDSAFLALTLSLRPEVKNHQVRVVMEGRGLVITLNQTAFFHSGAAEFDPSMFPTLEKIAAAIGKVNNPIRLEGHTDSLPIHTGRFRNNWELSSARGIAVLELLSSRFGIPSARMAIAGYADTSPVSSNDTDEGRARNRRVDIVVLTSDAMKREPG